MHAEVAHAAPHARSRAKVIPGHLMHAACLSRPAWCLHGGAAMLDRGGMEEAWRMVQRRFDKCMRDDWYNGVTAQELTLTPGGFPSFGAWVGIRLSEVVRGPG